MSERSLSEEHYEKIGELLSKAIFNKKHAHPSDLRRAAIVINSVIQSGFAFYETDLDDAIQKSNRHYSDSVKNYLIQMTNNYNDLARGSQILDKEQFEFKG